MVQKYNYPFPDKNTHDISYTDYYKYFQYFNFELSNFQKWAIYSIINNQHTLITAHTGSGKTLPAEFSIRYFTQQNKKVIYTSPIKALSNQKFYEFQKKFPELSIGILTGDNKHNPEADVIIMTTEILRNQLLTLIPKETNNTIPIHEINEFKMDIHNDCGIIIFDEIHYIDDPDRGAVWEQCIMHTPSNIPFLMLSASIGNSEQFSTWIESINSTKKVNICPTDVRVVPLKHYSFLTIPDSCIDKIKDKQNKQFIESNVNKFNLIKDEKNKIIDKTLINNTKISNYILQNKIFCYRKFVINKVLDNLKNNNMLPALCFVFSRKQVEHLASEINVKLWNDDELYDDPVTNTIESTCRQILVSKINNWKEYINNPDYIFLIKCLKNGIGFHHAGMIPIFKEMVELLYSMKKIKLLIATETFAVGLNMPTKTVLFTSLYKYNGNNMRLLEPHEYTQMSGRAGRRNIDTIGYVIHLTNLFEQPELNTYKKLIHSEPKKIKSRFKIGIPFIMNIIASNDYQSNPNTDYLCKHIEKSMMNTDIINEIKQAEQLIYESENKINQMTQDNLITTDSIEKYEKYSDLLEKLKYSKNKQKKLIQKQINLVIDNNNNFKKNYDTIYSNYLNIKKQLNENIKYKKYAEMYISTSISNIINILKNNNLIDVNSFLTSKGKIACSMMEIHSLTFADLYTLNNGFDDLNEIEILQLLSCFYSLKISDDKKTNNTSFLKDSDNIKKYILTMIEKFNYYYDEEIKYGLDIGFSYDYQLDLIQYFKEWSLIQNNDDCVLFFHKLKTEKDIFTGDFVKCCIKINNIIKEMKTVCEFNQNFKTLEKINNIQNILNKSIVTSESLYL